MMCPRCLDCLTSMRHIGSAWQHEKKGRDRGQSAASRAPRRREAMAQAVSLSSLQEPEREAILQVLYRDRAVRKAEEERIRKLKTHLQHLRWKGAKSTSREYQEKSCARCRRALGHLLNRGAVCQGCSHRVCSQCQVFLRRTGAWKCTVCFEDR
ncbi:Synaptotagmin-like protein 3 [Galemys pyrenaicus]|uniref:Synaptotagmin-like protein 3 n=1 Tax=Galemys pyrenaicus TaxID=202257 RepID=A0A8J6DUH8_GALPY|nr:Synaptotagmin-like protein 3 [Galemys pyrenaicus]